MQALACNSPNMDTVVTCGCKRLPAARQTSTLSLPADADQCLTVAKTSRCRRMRMHADAFKSQNHHTVNACGCRAMPAAHQNAHTVDACGCRKLRAARQAPTLSRPVIQSGACSAPNLHAVVACGCRQVSEGRTTPTLSTPVDERRWLQLAKASHCLCLRTQADAF